MIYRAPLFGAVVALYALFSISTPQDFGWAEVLIGAVLVVLVGPYSAALSFGAFPRVHQTISERLAHVCFLGLLILPTLVFIVRKNRADDFVRDLIPLLYFFLPVMLLPHFKNNPAFWEKALVVGLCIIGISFSVRHFLIEGVELADLGRAVIFGDLSYFPLNPAVLFSATFLLIFGLSKLERWKPQGLVLIALGLIPFAAIVAVLLRGQIVLVLASVLLYVLFLAKRKAILWTLTLGAVCAVFLTQAELVGALADLIVHKSEDVGLLNARDLEFKAVWHNAAESSGQAVFGEGWGGLIDNPAAEAVVRFTHNLTLYAILKGGVFGLLFFGVYCVLSAIKAWRNFRVARDPFHTAIAIAAGNTLLIHFFLETGFKTLSLGLVLSLVWLINRADKSAIAYPARPSLRYS